MKCMCELAQIIMVPCYFFKNTTLRYAFILIEMLKYTDICMFTLGYNVPNQGSQSRSKINISEGNKEIYMTFVPNEILTFVISNFIPLLSKYSFFILSNQRIKIESIIKTISLLENFRILYGKL